MARHPGYPFEPRTTTHLRPGDFWGVPTRRGGWWCCGRVLATAGQEPSRVMVVVGLLDWCGPEPPTTESIAGARVVAMAEAHVTTVRETGGVVLGHRPLQLDGIDPPPPGLPTWGYAVIERLAHERFGRHFPDRPVPADERPAGLGPAG